MENENKQVDLEAAERAALAHLKDVHKQFCEAVRQKKWNRAAELSDYIEGFTMMAHYVHFGTITHFFINENEPQSEPDFTGYDSITEAAYHLIRNSGDATAAHLQRSLRIGYPRAARALEELANLGVLKIAEGSNSQYDILIPHRGG